MARPKQGEGITAQQRLEKAFWELLEEAPYTSITIAGISQRAKVNHNTFYYYYDSLDDMVEHLLSENLIPKLPAQIIQNLAADTFIPNEYIDNEDVRFRFKRICLLSGANSTPWIVDRVKQNIMDIWLASANLTRSMLTHDEEIALCFIFGGMLSIIGEYGQAGDLSAFRSIANGPIGAGLTTVIRQIASPRAQETTRMPE